VVGVGAEQREQVRGERSSPLGHAPFTTKRRAGTVDRQQREEPFFSLKLVDMHYPKVV